MKKSHLYQDLLYHCSRSIDSESQGLDSLLECALGKIVNGLNKTIQDLLNDALLSVSNTGICIAEQFTSLLDGIINDISDTLDDH